MTSPADTLVRAIDAALARYPGLRWLELSSRAQADAIDREVLRIESQSAMVLTGQLEEGAWLAKYSMDKSGVREVSAVRV